METTRFTRSYFYELEAVSAGKDCWNGIQKWLFRLGIRLWGSGGPTLTRIGLEFLWTGPHGDRAGVLVNGPSRVSIWGSCGWTLTGSGCGVPVDGPSQGSIWGSCGRTLAGIDLGFLWTDPRADQFRVLVDGPSQGSGCGIPGDDPCGDRSGVPVVD